MTRKGFMGLGPEGLIKEDLIVILKGCAFPVVLRREGRASYIIVGACYLAGFMFGKFWDDGWRDILREETFKIC